MSPATKTTASLKSCEAVLAKILEPVADLQMVVVSGPRLVAELLHSNDLAKPTQPVMVHFRQVCPLSSLFASCCQTGTI